MHSEATWFYQHHNFHQDSDLEGRTRSTAREKIAIPIAGADLKFNR